mmetsp:Transcript_4854/g.12501  ORF Transcript_4854/g.12501 Transcript_4854/m.12501 type:complete len:246 (+) Transcript_4854:892-1629(+)
MPRRAPSKPVRLLAEGCQEPFVDIQGIPVVISSVPPPLRLVVDVTDGDAEARRLVLALVAVLVKGRRVLAAGSAPQELPLRIPDYHLRLHEHLEGLGRVPGLAKDVGDVVQGRDHGGGHHRPPLGVVVASPVAALGRRSAADHCVLSGVTPRLLNQPLPVLLAGLQGRFQGLEGLLEAPQLTQGDPPIVLDVGYPFVAFPQEGSVDLEGVVPALERGFPPVARAAMDPGAVRARRGLRLQSLHVR